MITAVRINNTVTLWVRKLEQCAKDSWKLSRAERNCKFDDNSLWACRISDPFHVTHSSWLIVNIKVLTSTALRAIDLVKGCHY